MPLAEKRRAYVERSNMPAQQYASGSRWPQGHFPSPVCNVSLLKYNYRHTKNQPSTQPVVNVNYLTLFFSCHHHYICTADESFWITSVFVRTLSSLFLSLFLWSLTKLSFHHIFNVLLMSMCSDHLCNERMKAGCVHSQLRGAEVVTYLSLSSFTFSGLNVLKQG